MGLNPTVAEALALEGYRVVSDWPAQFWVRSGHCSMTARGVGSDATVQVLTTLQDGDCKRCRNLATASLAIYKLEQATL